ncbi:Transcription factor SOX-8 [Leucoagaricus sp. SymC.cos]|nr:Transcription factor SOX-8 [Leucoagaricus sp. SymC.cos]
MPPRRGHDETNARTHIPRPPNAFILFRSAFIKSNHVPGKVEGNHSTLSKIIGRCWKALSPQERRPWEEKARMAQAQHRTLYPDWRWTPEANALGKKRVRKSKKSEPSDGDDSSETPSRRRARPKDKGKARERDAESDELSEDARVAKIADLVKEGKTGAELEKALEEWQATLPPPDPRPSKKRRTARRPPEPSTSAPDPDAVHQPSSSAPPPVSPPSRVHVFRRSPSDDASIPELTRLTTHISHEPSHTPSPTLFYPSSSRPVQPQPPPIAWPENATPASYPASQQSGYSQWWSSTSAASSSSPFGPSYDPPEITTTDGLGYDEDTNFDRGYTEQFGQISPPDDGNEGTTAQWTRNPGKHGICTVIHDPLRTCDDSPTASSPTSFAPPPVDVVSTPVMSSPSATQYFNPDGAIPSPPATSNAAAFIPSTYSSLTGWAGEYGDQHPSSVSSSSGGWFGGSGWQGPQRASSSWGQTLPQQQNLSHSHKMPYLDPQHQASTSLRLHSHPQASSNTLLHPQPDPSNNTP